MDFCCWLCSFSSLWKSPRFSVLAERPPRSHAHESVRSSPGVFCVLGLCAGAPPAGRASSGLPPAAGEAKRQMSQRRKRCRSCRPVHPSHLAAKFAAAPSGRGRRGAEPVRLLLLLLPHAALCVAGDVQVWQLLQEQREELVLPHFHCGGDRRE